MKNQTPHLFINPENRQNLQALAQITGHSIDEVLRDALSIYARAYEAIENGNGFGVFDPHAGHIQLYDTPTMDTAHTAAQNKAENEKKFRADVANDAPPSFDMTKVTPETIR